MDIVYNGYRPLNQEAPSIFLAGPTPRDKRVPSWRPRAVQFLKKWGFKGSVIYPEPAPREKWPSYNVQVAWEHLGLREADCIAFWIPRNMTTLPGMTTNIEYGMYMNTDKLVVGAPQGAPHTRDIRATAKMYGIPFGSSLEAVLTGAETIVAGIGENGGRILSRPIVWKGRFRRVELTKYRNRLGQVQRYETIRSNTFGDVVSVFALTTKREVVLVKSYRVIFDKPVFEKPAGICDKKGEDSAVLAARELLEETGYGGGSPMVLVQRGPIEAGFNDDMLSVFFTRDVHKLQEPKLEGNEETETRLVPLDELVNFVENKPEGCEVDVKLLGQIPILQARGLLA